MSRPHAGSPGEPLEVRVYRTLLRLLPATVRDEYGAAMVETFALKARRAAGDGALRRVGVGLREAAGLARAAWLERRRSDDPRPSSRRSAPTAASPNEPSGPDPTGRGPGTVSWLPELRHAARRLMRARAFSVAAILVLAIAIGGNAAIFSVLYGILLRPLPYPDPGRLTVIRHAAPAIGADDIEMTVAFYLLYRDDSESFESMALWDRRYRNLTGGGEPERIETIRATGRLFETLSVAAARGRALGPDDARPDADPVVVISDGLWRRRYGADPSIVGRAVRLDGEQRTVVGVMPRGFDFPRRGTDAWTPWTIRESTTPEFSFSYDAVARLRPGVSVEAATTELERILPRAVTRFGNVDAGDLDGPGLRPFVRPLRAHVVGDLGETLWLLAGAGGFLLLLACANLANLFLVRAEARTHELRIRAALGASTRQILAFWISESLWVAALGTAGGLALVVVGLDLLLGIAPELPRIETVGVDGAVVGFALALMVAVTLLFGLAPVLGDRDRVRAAGGRRETASRGRALGRRILVAAQVALSLTLLVGAALMVQTVTNLVGEDPGFDPEGALTFRVSLSPTAHPDRGAAARFHQRMLEALDGIPGVAAVGLIRCLPLQGWCGGNPVTSPESPLAPEEFRDVVSVKPIAPGTIGALGIPLLAGRSFDRRDHEDRTGAAIVNRALAERLFPGQSPGDVLGNRIHPSLGLERSDWYTIVGVVGTVRRVEIDEDPAEILYVPLLGLPGDRHLAPIHDMRVVLRTTGEPLDLIPGVRATIAAIDPELPIAAVRTLSEIHATATARTSFTSVLLSLAAGVGLLLGSVGIYGVVSWLTRQRTVEIGVRKALGARASQILRLVMTQGSKVIGAGIAAGLVASLVLTRLLASLLYRISATDATTFVAASALLGLVGAVATWLPARRAARIAPIESLRR